MATPPPFNSCSASSCRSAKGSMQYEIGDLQEDESVRTCTRYILRVVLAIHTCAAGVIRAVVGADGALEAKRERNSSRRVFF